MNVAAHFPDFPRHCAHCGAMDVPLWTQFDSHRWLATGEKVEILVCDRCEAFNEMGDTVDAYVKKY